MKAITKRGTNCKITIRDDRIFVEISGILKDFFRIDEEKKALSGNTKIKRKRTAVTLEFGDDEFEKIIKLYSPVKTKIEEEIKLKKEKEEEEIRLGKCRIIECIHGYVIQGYTDQLSKEVKAVLKKSKWEYNDPDTIPSSIAKKLGNETTAKILDGELKIYYAKEIIKLRKEKEEEEIKLIGKEKNRTEIENIAKKLEKISDKEWKLDNVVYSAYYYEYDLSCGENPKEETIINFETNCTDNKIISALKKVALIIK